MPERVMINDLPEQTTVLDSDLLVVQDATATKKMTVGRLTTQTQESIDDHLTATIDAHNASAISVVAGSGISSTNVQSALVELQGEISAGGITTEDAVDAVAAALVEGANVDIVYSDASNTITISATGGGGGVDAEAAVDAVAAALVEGVGIDIDYNDAANTITITNLALGGAAGHASYTFNATLTEPPAISQMRMNNVNQLLATRVWVSQNDVDGLDVSIGLARVLPGHQIYIQDYDDASKWIKYNVTAVADDGTYYDFTVTYHSGPGGLPTGSGAAGRVEFQPVAPGMVGVPPGGTVGQVLSKTGAADYVVGWVADQVGGGGITTEDAVDAVAGALVEGSGIDIVYNDAAGTITLTVIGGGGGGLSTEDAVDAVAAALVEASGIDIVYSDLGNTITFAVSNVPISDVVGLQTQLDTKATFTQLGVHETDTTNIHGISNTALLETTAGAQTKVDTHVNDTVDAHQASAIGGLGALATKSTVAAADIVDNSVTDAKLTDMPASRIKGTVGAGDPTNLTGTQVTAMLDVATTVVKGLGPPLPGSATSFLNGTGAYSVPTASNIAFAPTGTVAATDVQAAIAEVASEASGAPVRRILNAQTGTTYTPVLTDENKMVTLSNAAAITVTLPQNSTVGYTIGSEIDFLWFGVGQPTFVAGSGATVNATPGLKLRARYSACTAKKVATNDWIIFGDMAVS